MTNEHASQLLSAYVLGQLDAADRITVEQAIAADPELEQMAGFLRWLAPRLQQMNTHLPGVHATGEELVTAALGPGALPNPRGDWVRDHLAECGECRGLRDMVVSAHAESETEAEAGADQDAGATAAGRAPSSQAPRRTFRPLLGIAVAAVLVAMVVVVGVMREDTGHRSPPQAAIHLAGIARSAGEPVAITPSPDGELPPLVLECDPWIGRETAADFPLEIIFRDRTTGREALRLQRSTAATWSSEVPGLHLNLPPVGWAPGEYEVEVRDDQAGVIFQSALRLLPR